MSDQRDDRCTPGPWEAMNDYAPGVMTPWDVIAPGPCVTIATNLTEANARLIAAAPTLLAALREARKWLRCRSVACGTDGWQCKVCATKAIADAALKEFGQQSQIDEYADRIVSLESQVATLTRERDEARRQRDDWQSMVVVRNRNLDTQAARIAELERQVAELPQRPNAPRVPAEERWIEMRPAASGQDDSWMERAWRDYEQASGGLIREAWSKAFLAALRRHAPACQPERYPEVADFLDAVEPGWLLSSISDSDFSVFQVRAEIGGRRVTCYGRSLPEACRKWLDQHRAALAAKEKTDG